MKKIFTLMLTLACAMFVSVSCSTDATTDGEGVTPPAEEVVGDAVTFDALDVLGYEAGTLNLAYTVNVERALDDQLVLGEPTAAWLKVATPEDAEDYVILTWDKNNNSPNSPAREASFTATFGDNAPVTVTVKQNATTEVLFVVEYANVSPVMSCPVVHPVDLNMRWGYHIAAESALAQYEVTDPQAYFELWSAEQMQPDFMGDYFWQYGFASMNIGCSEPNVIQANRNSEEKVYLFVAGVNAEESMDEYGYVTLTNGKFATPVHIYEVEFLPMPALTLVGGGVHSMPSFADEYYTYYPEAIEPHVLTVNVKNPVENGALEVQVDEDWLTAVVEKQSEETFKVKFSCAANTYALPRTSSYTLSYGVNSVYSWGEPYLDSYVNIYEGLSIIQKKNENAQVPSYTVSVSGNFFNKFVVDVTTSDESVSYVVGAAMNNGEVDLVKTISSAVESRWSQPTYYTGNQTGVTLELNLSTMDSNNCYEFYVYACPVDTENKVVMAEPTFIKVTADQSNRPVLAWVETEDLKWNEAEQHYELYVDPSTEVTLSYTLTNPVEDGAVMVSTFSNYNKVFAGTKNDVVIDAEAKTVTFTLDAYHAERNNHHGEISLMYANPEKTSWYWNIYTESIRVIHKAPAADTPATPAE